MSLIKKLTDTHIEGNINKGKFFLYYFLCTNKGKNYIEPFRLLIDKNEVRGIFHRFRRGYLYMSNDFTSRIRWWK